MDGWMDGWMDGGKKFCEETRKGSHSTRRKGFTEETIESFSDSCLDGGEWMQMSGMEKPMVKA